MKTFSSIAAVLLLVLVFAQPVYAGIAIDPLLRPESAPTATGLDSGTDTGGSSDPETAKIAASLEYGESFVRAALLNKFTNVLLGLAGVVAIFSIINNAWWLIASGGKEESITQHKKGLMWAVVGLILIILSYSIIRFIISVPFQADQGPEEESGGPAAESAPQTPARNSEGGGDFQGSAGSGASGRGRSIEE